MVPAANSTFRTKGALSRTPPVAAYATASATTHSGDDEAEPNAWAVQPHTPSTASVRAMARCV